MKINRRAAVVSTLLLFGSAVALVRAEDVEKKFRVSFSVGSYDTQDKVPSDAANVATIVTPLGGVIAQFEDPRIDTATTASLTIKPALRYTFAAQYAFTKTFILEASGGYQKGDVGEIDVQAQLQGDRFDSQREPFNFRSLRQPGGEMTQVPLQLTALYRWRPRAVFNPYFGIGIGYTFVGFTPSAQLDNLSINMDATTADFTVQTPFPGGFGSSIPPAVDLQGASVEAPDTWEWHPAAGAEWTFKKKWSAFLDVRYVFASKVFKLGFNGEDSLGVSVPSGEFDLDSPEAATTYGTYFISPGLVDAGCLVPASAVGTVPCRPANNLGCDPQAPFGNAAACKFQGTPDGTVDPGFYYVKGGEIKYGGFSLALGIRYTF